ncbi:MAG TPA: hypothetical protein VGP42_05120 [Stellaceae bacterium]|nr:hypothetical protein [Stellaceae bacterium]
MAAHVKRDHIEIDEKPAPEMEIAVDAEAVAVADEEARSARIAVPAHLQHRTVLADHREDAVRLRDR